VGMVDDTPVSSTVTTGTVRGGAVSAREPEAAAPSRPPAAPSTLFEPTSEEEESVVDSGWASLADARVLSRLELAAPDPPRLLYEKAHEPSDESPILYCERVYVVDSLQSDQELADHLLKELEAIRAGWRDRDSPQFVQLAAFDHSFEKEPEFPPLATLSWKDWQGRTELWVRGVRRSGPPPAAEEFSSEAEAARASTSTEDATPVVSTALPQQSRPHQSGDSGTSWQSPARSGEYPIPNVEEPSSPPSSQRMPAGEELIGALFERMNELSYLPDLPAGAGYVLATLEEFIPCSGIAIHVLDPAARQFVLVRALGPRAAAQLRARQPALDSGLGEAVRHGRALRVGGASGRLWAPLGLDIAHALCAPVQQRDRVFGAIELGRSAAEGEFSDGQLEALEFICEQFAEFLAERPFSLDLLP
jgi:GAF domain